MAERHCILVIDDEQDIIDSFAMLLGTYGYDVVRSFTPDGQMSTGERIIN